MMQQQQRRQAGFTILELMIATVVVSIILLLVTSVMIGLQNLYNKGINQENVQNNVRNITDTVTQEIQDANVSEGAAVQGPVTLPFSTRVNSNTYTVEAICIGSVRYMYVIGLQVGNQTGEVQQALWQDSYPPDNCGGGIYESDGTTPNPSMNILINTPTDGGTAYIASGARLTDFQIIPPSSAPGSDPNYTIYVSVAIGNDNSLKLNYNAPANPPPNYDYGARCITETSDQFCAAASLSTEVGQRVQ